MKDYILPHELSMDGQSSGFSPAAWQINNRRPTYDHPYKINSILDRLTTEEAKKVGFGYEECRNILVHDKNQYDEYQHCVNEDLKYFCKENLFLKKAELDYDNIFNEYID